MDDFNDAEQDWFSDVNDEPIKSNLFAPVDSPCGGGMGRADSRLSDFNALNVPVDDSFYVSTTQQPSDVSAYNAGSATYATNNDASTAYYDPTGGGNYAEMSSNIGGGALDADDVDTAFPQPFQDPPTMRATVRNSELPTQFEMPAFNSSSYIDCPPSTSSASHVQSAHDAPSSGTIVYSQQQQHQPQQQQYQIVSNVTGLQQEQQHLQQQQLLNHSHQQQLLEQQQTHLYQCSQAQLPQQQQSQQQQQLPMQDQQQFHQQAVFQAKTYYPSSAQRQLSSGSNVAEPTPSNFVYAQQQSQQQYQQHAQHFLPQQQQSQQQQDVQQYSSYTPQQASTSAAATTFGNQAQSQLQYSNAQIYQQQIMVTSQPQTHIVQIMDSTPSLGVPPVPPPSQTHYVEAGQQQTLQYAQQTSPSSLPAPRNSTNRRASKPNARRQSKQNLLGRPMSTVSTVTASSSTMPAGAGSSATSSSTSGFTLGAVMQKIFANAGDANAAVRFTPERNAEFLAMINQLNELRERQDKTGVLLAEEISAVEERIINMLSAAEPDNVKTTPNDGSIGYQMGTSAIDAGTTTAPKTGRGKARRPAASRTHFPQTNQPSQPQMQASMRMLGKAGAPIMDVHAPLQASTSAGIVAVDGNGTAATTFGAYTTMTVPNSEPAMQLAAPNLPNGVVMMSTDNRNMILVPTTSDDVNGSNSSVELAHHQTIASQPVQHQPGNVGTYLLADGTTTSLTAMPMPLDVTSLPSTPPQPQATLIAPRPRSKARQNQRTSEQLSTGFSPSMGPPLAPMTNYGKTKRAINYAEKYQELAEQKLKLEEEKRVQEQQPNDPPLVQTVTIKKIDPPLANLSGQMLEAIISRVTLQRDADTAISVNINGEVLTLVVHMTLAPQQTPLPQQQLQQQPLTPISTVNYLPPTRTTVPLAKASRQRGGRASASAVSTTPVTSTLVSARDRASASLSTTSGTSNAAPSSSTFDLDDTIARVVCQQASLAGTSTSSSIRNLMNSDDHLSRGSGSSALINISKETTLGTALQPYARGPARRKSKAKSAAMSSQLELMTRMDMMAPPALIAGSQPTAPTTVMIAPNGSTMLPGGYAPAMIDQTSQVMTQPKTSSLMVPPPPPLQQPTEISQSAMMMAQLEPLQPAKPQLPVLPAPAELGKQIAASRAERTTKLSKQFKTLRDSLATIDYRTPFINRKDALNRLLPYAFLYEPDLSEEFMSRIDHNLLRQSIELEQQKTCLEQRMRKILLKESMVEHSTRHEVNMLLFLDAEYERRALVDEKWAARENSHLDSLTKSVDDVSRLGADTRKSDFEYHEFDPAKYRDISPYVSPIRRSPISLSDDDSDRENFNDRTKEIVTEEDISNDEDVSDEDEYEEYTTDAEDEDDEEIQTEKQTKILDRNVNAQPDELTQIEEMEFRSSSVDNILMNETENCENAATAAAPEVIVSETFSQIKRSPSYIEDVATALNADVYEWATHEWELADIDRDATLRFPQGNLPGLSPTTCQSPPPRLGTPASAAIISTDADVPTPPMWSAESLHAVNPTTGDSMASCLGLYEKKEPTDNLIDMKEQSPFVADVNQRSTSKLESNVSIEASPCMPAVKLKIKLGGRSVIETTKSLVNDNKSSKFNGEDTAEVRRRAKEEKRQRKEEKRQRKLLKRQKKEGVAPLNTLLAKMTNESDRATNSDAETAQVSLSPPPQLLKAFSSENCAVEMSQLHDGSLELKKKSLQESCWRLSNGETAMAASSNGLSTKTNRQNSISEAVSGINDDAGTSSNGQSLKLRISKRALISSSIDFSVAPSTSLSSSANATTNPLSIKIARNGIIRQPFDNSNINDDAHFDQQHIEYYENSATNEKAGKKRRKKHDSHDISRAERKRRKKREREERKEAERRSNEHIDEIAEVPPILLPKKLPMLRIRLPRPVAATSAKNDFNLGGPSIDQALVELKTSPPKTFPSIDAATRPNNNAQYHQSQNGAQTSGIVNRQVLPDLATSELMSSGGRFLFAGVTSGTSIVSSTASSTWLSSSTGTTFPPMMTGHTAFSMATTSGVATAAGSLQTTSYNALRFSPCSEDSDDEQLRNRTDQLLTKLKGHV